MFPVILLLLFTTPRGKSDLKTAILVLFEIISPNTPLPLAIIQLKVVITFKVRGEFFPENFQYFDRKVSTYYERKIWLGRSCEKPVFRVIDTALLIWLKSCVYLIDKNDL